MTPLQLDADLTTVLRDVVERHTVANRWRSRPGSPLPQELLWVREAAPRGGALSAPLPPELTPRLLAAVRWCREQNQVGGASAALLERLRAALEAARDA